MLTGPGATIAKARALRREMSLPEVLLWRELRRRPGGLKFRRQHPAGPYVLDFACIRSKLAIEIDGEAHSRGEKPVRDEARDAWLANQGYRTIRIPARDVLADLNAVVRFVIDRCAAAQPLHQPTADEQVRLAPRAEAMSGGHGDLLIPPRTGEDL